MIFMKKIILAVCISLLPILSSNSFQIDPNKIRREKLEKALELNSWELISNRTPIYLKKCNLSEEGIVAYVTRSPKEVFICTTSIDKFDVDELAFILLHEHWHYLNSQYSDELTEEKDADTYAASMAKMLGFDNSVCENFIKMAGGWSNPDLFFYTDSTHPAPLKRYSSCLSIFKN